ncbi:hypothetical protein KUCAC02_034896 [Chaenocephalus aceratus]|nr:hypothetical protein KUCAC02_034896 [Chaenocephalus aceratus]
MRQVLLRYVPLELKAVLLLLVHDPIRSRSSPPTFSLKKDIRRREAGCVWTDAGGKQVVCGRTLAGSRLCVDGRRREAGCVWTDAGGKQVVCGRTPVGSRLCVDGRRREAGCVWTDAGGKQVVCGRTPAGSRLCVDGRRREAGGFVSRSATTAPSFEVLRG